LSILLKDLLNRTIWDNIQRKLGSCKQALCAQRSKRGPKSAVWMSACLQRHFHLRRRGMETLQVLSIAILVLLHFEVDELTVILQAGYGALVHRIFDVSLPDKNSWRLWHMQNYKSS